MSHAIDIVDHCTDIHILPHDKPQNAIESVYQCFHANRKFNIDFQNISDALLQPIQDLSQATDNYDKMLNKITEEDYDSRRKLRDIQKQFVLIYFGIETKIQQIELPQFYHKNIEHIFFKIETFIKKIRENMQFIALNKKSIERYKQNIIDLKSNVLMLNELREIRTNARTVFEQTLQNFRNSIHAEYQEQSFQ